MSPVPRHAKSGRAKLRQGAVVTPDELRRQQDEAGFQRQVTEVLDSRHWHWYHANLSIRDRRGFPDLVAVRFGRVLWIELKSVRGVLTDDQQRWLRWLDLAGQETHVWRPTEECWQEIDQVTR